MSKKPFFKNRKTKRRAERSAGRAIQENRIRSGRSHRRWRIFFSVLMVLFLLLASIVLFTIVWVKQTWAELALEEIVYQLTMPLEGTGGGMIGDFILNAVVPASILMVFWFCLLWLFRKLRTAPYLITTGCISLAAILTIGIAGTYFWFDIGCDDYFFGDSTGEDFIAEHYVDPKDVTLTFPEQKRNLIYIYLESMETTFSDDKNGGKFGEDNLIPELTALAQENEDFSGSEDTLNGGTSLPGSTWTVGAMFAETSGLPLKISIGGNEMSDANDFFPAITTLGDILQEEGYRNELLIGSDASFGGRDLYFSTHGNYSLLDYNYARNTGLIAPDYHVFWGYEDEKLFSIARNELTNLASSGEPFNLTLLTVDTHFEDGYICDLCDDRFGDNQYANVIACSSRQVAAFVEWISQQDFFDNTTIVISGDHPTMDADFLKDVYDENIYQRQVYTTYINAGTEVEEPDIRRSYSTFDDFPTTLAALGVDIEGDRLGLGTNLFSSTDTLLETFGLKTMISSLSKKSSFMDNLSALENENTDVTKYSPSGKFEAKETSDKGLLLTVSDIKNDDGTTTSAYVTIAPADTEEKAGTGKKEDGDEAENDGEDNNEGEETAEDDTAEDDTSSLQKAYQLNDNGDGTYSGTVSADQLKEIGKKLLVRCYAVNSEGYEYEIGTYETK